MMVRSVEGSSKMTIPRYYLFQLIRFWNSHLQIKWVVMIKARSFSTKPRPVSTYPLVIIYAQFLKTTKVLTTSVINVGKSSKLNTCLPDIWNCHSTQVKDRLCVWPVAKVSDCRALCVVIRLFTPIDDLLFAKFARKRSIATQHWQRITGHTEIWWREVMWRTTLDNTSVLLRLTWIFGMMIALIKQLIVLFHAIHFGLEYYLIGDLNRNMASTQFDSNTRLLCEVSDTYGLQQLITKPTRITESSTSLIDVIFTNIH